MIIVGEEELEDKKYIIFGAGRFGEEALLYYGVKNVAYFCDNKKCGQFISGVEVIDFRKLIDVWKEYHVLLAVSMPRYKAEIQKQLEEQDITYEIFKSIEDNLQGNNFSGKFEFVNRSKFKEKMLMVLAGYKEYLWKDVFGRLEKYISADIDVCIMTAGYENEVLKELCRKNDWSYLSTAENKVSLIQNIAIEQHPEAKWIYKLDEDIFVTDGMLERLFASYMSVWDEGKYDVGFVAPIMAINSYGYRRLLDRFDWIAEYEERFGKAVSGKGEILINPDAAEFLWRRTVPIDEFARKIAMCKEEFSICYHRYSIGCILISRIVWKEMGGFKNASEGVLGVDEEYLCQWCMNNSYAIIIDEKAYAGHFAYGPQTARMRELYNAGEIVI